MTARQFVKLATLEAARALRIDDEVGSLEPGKQADIIAVDLSKSIRSRRTTRTAPRAHGEPGERADDDGRRQGSVYEDRTWTKMDKERLTARAEEMRVKLPFMIHAGLASHLLRHARRGL